MKLRRSFSLHYKFLLLTIFLSGCSLICFLILAVSLFNADKAAYIYDNNAALVETMAEEVQTGLVSSIRTARLAALSLHQGSAQTMDLSAIKNLVLDDDNFAAFLMYSIDSQTMSLRDTAPTIAVLNETYLKPYEIGPNYFAELQQQINLPIELAVKKQLLFGDATKLDGIPLLGMYMAMSSTASGPIDRLVVGYLRQDRRLAAFKRSQVYTSYLVDASGNIILHSQSDANKGGAKTPLADEIKGLVANQVQRGAKEIVDDNKISKIVAFKKIPLGDLVVVSEIPTDKAFVAAEKLIQKSVLFAVLVFCVAFLVSLLFTRRLTAALRELYAASRRIASGDFNIDLKVTTRDEVGALSYSFTRMAKQITKLLAETADKARMEKELETAQLVQDNFFPKADHRIGDFEVAAFFQPATECGGDWWGCIPLGNKFALLIGDATGHGVPAALITAAAHSCTSTLQALYKSQPNFDLSASKIMNYLNTAVCESGKGKVKMTFFVAVIEPETGKISYSNASHEPPLICRDSQKFSDSSPAGKDQLDTFADDPDVCLGESLDTKFHEYHGEIKPGDCLIFYTDGLVECRNQADDEYGERRLTKSLLQAAHQDVQKLREKIVDDARTFFGERKHDDDVTLIAVKRNLAMSIQKAG